MATKPPDDVKSLFFVVAKSSLSKLVQEANMTKAAVAHHRHHYYR
jgi:hypothetical protein